MNIKTQLFLRNIDYKIYLFKWFITRKYVEFRIRFEKNEKERDKLLALYLWHPFSSKYDFPYPSIIEKLCERLK